MIVQFFSLNFKSNDRIQDDNIELNIPLGKDSRSPRSEAKNSVPVAKRGKPEHAVDVQKLWEKKICSLMVFTVKISSDRYSSKLQLLQIKSLTIGMLRILIIFDI